jgi:hypothetical protein
MYNLSKEITKTEVERAIEQNEEVVIERINQQLEALGVELVTTDGT